MPCPCDLDLWTLKVGSELRKLESTQVKKFKSSRQSSRERLQSTQSFAAKSLSGRAGKKLGFFINFLGFRFLIF